MDFDTTVVRSRRLSPSPFLRIILKNNTATHKSLEDRTTKISLLYFLLFLTSFVRCTTIVCIKVVFLSYIVVFKNHIQIKELFDFTMHFLQKNMLLSANLEAPNFKSSLFHQPLQVAFTTQHYHLSSKKNNIFFTVLLSYTFENN